jgi:hypothetical protein
MDRLIEFASSRRPLLALAVVSVALLLITQLASPAVSPSASYSGPTRAGANGGAGIDLQCGNGLECGPNNPAVKVAPSLPVGPKSQP